MCEKIIEFSDIFF